jgi:hypothetical protein
MKSEANVPRQLASPTLLCVNTVLCCYQSPVMPIFCINVTEFTPYEIGRKWHKLTAENVHRPLPLRGYWEEGGVGNWKETFLLVLYHSVCAKRQKVDRSFWIEVCSAGHSVRSVFVWASFSTVRLMSGTGDGASWIVVVQVTARRESWNLRCRRSHVSGIRANCFEENYKRRTVAKLITDNRLNCVSTTFISHYPVSFSIFPT